MTMTDIPLQPLPQESPRKTSATTLRLFLVVICGLFFLGLANFSPRPKAPPEVPPKISDAYSKISLSARSAFVLDVKTGKELFNLNGDAQLPLASLTKIMMAVRALSLASESQIITIDPGFLESEGDSGLFANERWTLKGLIDLTLLESSNDGANAVASVVGAFGQENAPYDLSREQFVNAMNKKATELGLTQTYFLNPTGLDENAFVSGAYGSARDMANLFAFALKTYPQLFGVTRYDSREFESLSLLKHNVKNTNTFVGNIPSLLGSKTGYTDLAGGNLVIAFDAGVDRPIVISILGSTEQGRFEDAEKLVWSTLDFLGEAN